MLEVHQVSSFYGDFQALKEVSLKIEDGELVLLFGPNGHGKSTLLKTICGLINPSSGYIKFNESIINKLSTEEIVELGIVYIAEERHLFPEMTVLENLKLGAYNRNARKKESERLEYVFHLFPKLKAWNNKIASTLSGGEARMLSIGRGLMSAAKFLAIDEPSFGLAPNLRVDVFDKIAEINKSGTSIILVEQNSTQATDLLPVDKIFLLEDGRIVFEGDKKAALNNEHVKEVFLGI
jgi:branched-chain amino acid transport system ATP-binding protein